MLARISHPMHTYLLGREKNQSIRSSADTHTNTHRQRQTWSLNANHWTYISIRTKTHTKANVEPERQSLDLHRHPNQTKLTLEPERHSMDLHQLPSTQQPNKLIGSRELEPITVKHTHKKEKKCPERPRTVSCLRTSSGMRIRAT